MLYIYEGNRLQSAEQRIHNINIRISANSRAGVSEDNGLLQVDPLYENKMGDLKKGAFWRIFRKCTYISKKKKKTGIKL